MAAPPIYNGRPPAPPPPTTTAASPDDNALQRQLDAIRRLLDHPEAFLGLESELAATKASNERLRAQNREMRAVLKAMLKPITALQPTQVETLLKEDDL